MLFYAVPPTPPLLFAPSHPNLIIAAAMAITSFKTPWELGMALKDAAQRAGTWEFGKSLPPAIADELEKCSVPSRMLGGLPEKVQGPLVQMAKSWKKKYMAE